MDWRPREVVHALPSEGFIQRRSETSELARLVFQPWACVSETLVGKSSDQWNSHQIVYALLQKSSRRHLDVIAIQIVELKLFSYLEF